ncbi:MAG: class I SAM-dependent methyltransferase [Gammaproteobacteria bacterium]
MKKAESQSSSPAAKRAQDIRATAKHAVWVLLALWRSTRGAGPGYCLVGGHTVPAFLPYRAGVRSLSPILRDLDLVGSDLERFRCPLCGSTDRERHLLAYLQREQSVQFQGKRVLHFAPESAIRNWIVTHEPLEYIQADLLPFTPGVLKIDITEMPFESGYFDVVVANHVLEHVSRDSNALREISRVLKHGGHAIIQTPFAARLPATLEIDCIKSAPSRLALYGQEDHVRLYGVDLVQRIEANGLSSRMKNHSDLLADIDPIRHGVNPREPLFLFVKR